MARPRLKRFYRPVKKHRGLPRDWKPPEVDLGEGLSKLTVYLLENEASGLSRAELVEQFHEYDCEGELEDFEHIRRCTGCDYWEIVKNDSG
jgi:hypothetical protein